MAGKKFDAAGVYNGEVDTIPLSFGIEPVTGRASYVGYNGQPSSRNAVK
jgi:hypothetical protein